MKQVAIYARKSVESDKGDSIQTQINKCKEYVRATAEDGVEYAFIEYADEGYTGAHTFRPAFQRLMRDVGQGKIDQLICYRLDRITRSAADFAGIDDLLQKNDVSFFSVSERFETSTIGGRAFLGIAIVFAQLERETIRERITDSMYELAKTDRWVAGEAPLGYKRLREKTEGSKKEQTVLVIDHITAASVQLIFSKYVELRSMTKLETYLLQKYVKSRNGNNLTTSQLAIMLKNPTYVQADERIKDYYLRLGASFYGDVNGACGLMLYGKSKGYMTEKGKYSFKKADPSNWVVSVGTHHGIIDADTWLEVQRIMAENSRSFPISQRSHIALVSSLLRCAECGTAMAVNFGKTDDDGNVAYYYHCKLRKRSNGVRCSNANARGDLVDQAVINEIKSKGIEKDAFLGGLREQLQKGKMELAHDPVAFIRGDIQKKEGQINRLVDRISLEGSEDMAARYEDQIRALQQDIVSLQAEILAIGAKKDNAHQSESVLAFLEKLLEKCELIDELELDERQELVRVLFKRILWHAETGTLSFEYANGDDGGDGCHGDTDRDNGGGSVFAPLESVIMGDPPKISHHYTQGKPPSGTTPLVILP